MRSKRYQDNFSKLDKNKSYPLSEAISLMKQLATARFDESVEMHVKTGINPEKGDQQIRSSVELPHGSGKKVRVIVFCEDKREEEAKKSGADIVGGISLIEEIKKTQKTDFDIALATPAMMKSLAQIARVLGPRGLMPSPKNQTVTENIAKAVEALKKGRVNFKNDNTSNIHVMLGKISFSEIQLKENIAAFLEALKKAKPASAKGTFIKKITLCSSMGPGIKIAS
ncbi:MAG: 50S ribosomal protein L1 [Parcubacteria group bacterium]|nr:50S ribosomal protein L1 [Parcubacteria group bacterium]